jgi:hypothetical protein
MKSSFETFTYGTFRISWSSYQGMLSVRLLFFPIYVLLSSNVFCVLGPAPQSCWSDYGIGALAIWPVYSERMEHCAEQT